MPTTSTTIRPTRFPGLGYRQDFPGLWRFYDIESGETGAIGPHYKTKAELLSDAYRFALERGFHHE